jgi:methyl-accepting chemotaxis protein
MSANIDLRSENILREAELKQQAGFLRAFCVIAFVLQGAVFVFSVLFGLFTGVINFFNLALLLPFFLATYFSNKLAEKNLRLSTWLLVLPMLILIMSSYIQFGTALPIFIAYLIPLALVTVLLGWRDSLVLTGFTVFSTLALYILQDFTGIYKPLSIVGQTEITGTNIFLLIVILPALPPIFILPAVSQEKLRREQNHQLAKALQDLETQQNSTRQVINQMQGLVTELKTTAEQQASGSHEQAISVEQINATMAELSSTAAQIAQMTEQVGAFTDMMAEDSSQIDRTTSLSVKRGSEGIESVQNTVIATREVAGLYQELSRTLEELNLKSVNMRKILDLIDNLSSETHLLSLNAAIEAAGAGPYGERFNVVAQEVKELANRSGKANNEAKALMEEFEAVNLKAVSLTDNGFQKASAMENVVDNTREIIAGLVSVVNHAQEQASSIVQVTMSVLELTDVIRTSTVQQRSASEQVLSSLTGLRVVAQQNAEASRMVSNTATRLEEVSLSLSKSLEIPG